MCGILGLAGSIALYKASPYAGLDMTVEEIRRDYTGGSRNFSYYNYANVLLTPFYPFGTFLASLKKKLSSAIILFIFLFFLGAYFISHTTGGRPDLLIIFFITLAVLIVNKPYYFKDHKKHILIFLVIFITGNITFHMFRTKELRKYRQIYSQQGNNIGNNLLKSYGTENSSQLFSESISLIWGYTGASLIHFDNFLHQYNFEPQFGLYHFANFGNRFTSHNRAKVKMAIDMSQTNLGIYYNIWATGLREVVVDFGKVMLFPVLFFCGFFIGKLRGMINSYISARCLYCLLLAWLIALPFVSLLTNRTFENAVLFCFLWFFIEAFTTHQFHKKRKLL